MNNHVNGAVGKGVPVTGALTIQGRNGGRLRRGGTNRGGPGRLPTKLLRQLETLISDPEVTAAWERILKDDTHKHHAVMSIHLMNRVGGKPRESVDLRVTEPAARVSHRPYEEIIMPPLDRR